MAIDPSIDALATAQAFAAQKANLAGTPAPNVPFGDFLSKSGAPQEQVTAAAAAEILKLKMLNSAISLGDEEEGRQAATRSLGVQGILDRFLEQLPQPQPGSPAQAAGGNEAAAPVASAGSADVAAAESAGGIDGGSAGLTLEGIIQKASRRYGVDGGLIKAVIKAESDFNPRAVSPVGAQGLMQLMPSTARGLGVTDPFDPEQNVMAGTRFLKDMLQRYGGNLDEALAAYNWGPGNVDRHGTDRLPHETRAYLGRVKGLYAQNVG